MVEVVAVFHIGAETGEFQIFRFPDKEAVVAVSGLNQIISARIDAQNRAGKTPRKFKEKFLRFALELF